MQRRFTDLETRVATAFFAVVGLATIPAGLVGTPLPIVVAVFVFATGFCGLLYGAARSSADPHARPVVSHVLVVALLASTLGFATAWVAERPDDPASIEFVVVPHDLVAIESVAPGPNRESRAVAPHGYGDHVFVTCYVRGVDRRLWYQLRDDNFMPSRDLAPLLFSDDRPSAC